MPTNSPGGSSQGARKDGAPVIEESNIPACCDPDVVDIDHGEASVDGAVPDYRDRLDPLDSESAFCRARFRDRLGEPDLVRARVSGDQAGFRVG